MIKNLVLLTCLALSAITNAQIEKGSAYIISLKGDTIKGSIKDQPEEGFSKSIEFANLDDSKKFTTYYPWEIKGFGFEGIHQFESQLISIPYKRDTTKEYRFLRTLLKGNVTLYSMSIKDIKFHIIGNIPDNGIEYQYYIKLSNGKLFRLSNEYLNKKIPSSGNDSIWEVFESKKYIGIIKYLLADCSPVVKRVDKCRYKESEITDLISTYNNWYLKEHPSETIETPNTELSYKEKFAIGITGGFSSLNMVGINNEKWAEYDNYSFNIASPSFGALLTYKSSKHIKLKLYCLYQKLFTNETINKDFIGNVDTFTLNMNNLTILGSANYYITIPNYQPYIEFGIGVSKALAANNKLVRNYGVYSRNFDFNLQTEEKFIFFGSLGIEKSTGLIRPFLNINYSYWFNSDLIKITGFGINIGVLYDLE